MTTILADSFTSSLARLGNEEQKQAKLTAFDLQLDPDRPGLQFHRVDQAVSADVWSVRVNRDVRIIVQRSGGNLTLVYVGHHDDAYGWARRRRIGPNPATGALQIVEVRELVEERPVPRPASPAGPASAPPAPRAALLFGSLSDAQLLSIGVPEDWIADVRAATDDSFFDLEPHLPPEARDALLEFAQSGVLPPPPPASADPLEHPDTQRRFRVVEGIEELRAALDAPFEKWAVFLHPAQRALVERRHGGPARVVGSAGTGKTVVALHRVRHLLQSSGDGSRVLLTTFSEPLARELLGKLRVLLGADPALLERVQVGSFERVAAELYELDTGNRPHFARTQLIRTQLRQAADDAGAAELTSQFLLSEWENVLDAWQIGDAQTYGDVPRLGRRSRLGVRQRDRLWPIFASVRDYLSSHRLLTEPGLFAAVAAAWRPRSEKPFSHIVVDEAQDLGVPELRFLSSIAPDAPDALFFAGDLGQRIFRQPFSWRALGVDVRGRSATLKVNYRTSHQIRRAADQLLPASVRDVDGIEDDRRGTISVFDGPEPEVILAPDEAAEIEKVARRLQSAIDEGVLPSEIGVFVRSEDELARAQAAVRKAGHSPLSLADVKGAGRDVLVGTMHLAKGLEFRLVVVMACDAAVLPRQARLKTVADDYELDEVLRTERQLFYVALTRARDRVIVSAAGEPSEFVAELSVAR